MLDAEPDTAKEAALAAAECRDKPDQAQQGLLPCCVGWVNRQTVGKILANINVKEMKPSEAREGCIYKCEQIYRILDIGEGVPKQLGESRDPTSFNSAKNLEAPTLFSVIIMII